MQAPRAVRIQNLNLHAKALVVIIILIGPATGIEKMNPAVKPIMVSVKILSIIK